jgi:hypothetical protein
MAGKDHDTSQNIEFGGGPVTNEQAQAFQELPTTRRKQRYGTQMEAAKGAGVSQTLISTLERGAHTGMRVIDLRKVLRAYGIEPNEVASILGYFDQSNPRDPGDNRVKHLALDLQHMPADKRDRALGMIEALLKGLS